MTAHPAPSGFETRTNATYEALMWALSRPGLAREMPTPGQAAIIEALIDRECRVHCADPELAEVAGRTGARLVEPARADHLFFDSLPTSDILGQIGLGSDLHPEAGATLVCNAVLGKGPRLRLTGPGCDGAVEVRIGGLPDGFWQARARLMRYPMGFELFFVDGARVLGIPRSTTVSFVSSEAVAHAAGVAL
jgi:alpha-D-ribose 1-methylphosphonate 5-triphosphate synthase subunit PhnH